jgi:cytochrome b
MKISNRLRSGICQPGLFHWTLVALMIAQWLTAQNSGAMDYHVWGGYAVLALVLFRLIWGVMGSETARFGAFVRGPGAALAYVKALLRGETPLYLGHNPMGGWSIVAMLILLLVQAGTGLFANDDILIEGPLYSWVSKRRQRLADHDPQTQFQSTAGRDRRSHFSGAVLPAGQARKFDPSDAERA